MSAAAYERQRPEARKLGEIARKLLRRKKFYEKGKYAGLRRAWTAAVGERIAGRTRVRSMKNGEVVVEVDSPALLHELNNYMKEQILSSLQGADGGRDVASLRFRLQKGPKGGEERLE